MMESVYKLGPQRTFPGLQHDFCGLWDRLVDTPHDDKDPHISWLYVTTDTQGHSKGLH
jgi:hypothetical protein